MSHITFLVRILVRPGREADFLALLEPVLDAMRHEASFINAVLHRDESDPYRFMLYETWTDLEDVKTVQIARPYRDAYHSALDELLQEPRQVEFWQPVRTDFTAFASRA